MAAQSNRAARTPKKRTAFLKALGDGASIMAASVSAGMGRRTAYDWREADEAFAKAWDDAIEAGTDVLEDEAVRRARDGSDTLLIFMLKARRPKKYKERIATEHSGEVRHRHHVDPAKIASDIESKLAGLAANGAQTEVSKEPDAQ